MNIKLMKFQLKCIKTLIESMGTTVRDIILKSPTGSGKTIILTHFMEQYLKSNPKTIFVWLTPGKGNLEEQSKDKMDKYIHNASTKLLSDVMTSGFAEDDCCFINWEKLTKKGNNALKDSERTNFVEWIEKAIGDGLSFKIIIDESHQNFTAKADEIIQLFRTNKIVRCSATPLINKTANLIEVSEQEVIEEGLIKKLLVINENLPQEIHTNNQTEYLLEKGLEKQRELRKSFVNAGINVNPLILVQLPNDSDSLLEHAIIYFESKGISIENEELAIWLSSCHENLNNIELNDAKQKVVIIKQAIATGWDCPRAYILVKLRENMDETFEIQTIGRIRRMPEAKHYDNDSLDSCYLYTFDAKFTQGVKQAMGTGALDAKTIFLKKEHYDFKLKKEQRTMIQDLRNPRLALSTIYKFLKTEFNLNGDKKKNKIALESNNFIFSNDVIRTTISGVIVNLEELSEQERLNSISINEPINTTKHGREYHNRVSRIGLEIHMDYADTNAIIGKLFGEKFNSTYKILKMPPKELYAFIINNFDNLRRIFRGAMAKPNQQVGLKLPSVSIKDFFFPKSCIFTYNSNNKIQNLSTKNVYQDYLLSAEPRSNPEKKFEKYCESNMCVDWIYKNGDKGDEFFSILYLDNAGTQKLFYPDYIVSVKGKTWIIETKGDFASTGESQDIDIYTPIKAEYLNAYLDKNNLNGGIVRYDNESQELCICQDGYNDDIRSDTWKLLSDIWN